jgi:predicted  nucleic acid-binding Zn-ribbon protein
MEKILKEILDEIKNINKRLVAMEANINNMKNDIGDMKTDIKDLKQGQNDIKSHLESMDIKNADRHLEAFSKISSIDKDIKFIKHKLHQTEEDVFDIKDHLKIIK